MLDDEKLLKVLRQVMAEHAAKDLSLLRIGEVMQRTKESRSAIFAGIAAGTFPPGFKIEGRKGRLWDNHTINQHLRRVIDAAAPANETLE